MPLRARTEAHASHERAERKFARSRFYASIDDAYSHRFYAEAAAGDTTGASGPAPAGASTAAAAGDGKPAAAAAASTASSAGADGKPAAGAAASVAALEPVIGATEGEAAEPTVDEQRAYLVEKGGKADEIAKLDEAALKAQFDLKKGEEGKALEAKPGELDVKLPEGIKEEDLDAKQFASFKEIMQDDKLSASERASKLIELHATELRAAAEKPMQVWFTTQKAWQDEVKADAEIGGAALDTNRANMAKAITDIMGDKANETFDALKFTGAANHPAIVRLIARMSKAFVEGTLTAGAAPGTASKGLAQSIQAMYPSATGNQSAGT